MHREREIAIVCPYDSIGYVIIVYVCIHVYTHIYIYVYMYIYIEREI